MAGSYERHWSLSMDENLSEAFQRIAASSANAETAMPRMAQALEQGLNAAMQAAKATEEELQALLAQEIRLTAESERYRQVGQNRFQDTQNKNQFVSPAVVAAQQAELAASRLPPPPEFVDLAARAEEAARAARAAFDPLMTDLQQRLTDLTAVKPLSGLTGDLATAKTAVYEFKQQIAELKAQQEQAGNTAFAGVAGEGLSSSLDVVLNARLAQVRQVSEAVQHLDALLAENPVQGKDLNVPQWVLFDQTIGRTSQTLTEAQKAYTQLVQDMQRQIPQPKIPDLPSQASLDKAISAGTKRSMDEYNASMKESESIARQAAAAQKALGDDVERTGSKAKDSGGFFKDFSMGMTGSVTAGLLAAQAVQALISKVQELGSAIIENGQNQEQYMAVFTRLTGSVQTAGSMIDQTRQQSLQLPVAVNDLLNAQRRYQAAIADGQTVNDRYGTSMQNLLKVTADVAAARPDINVQQLATAIERVSVGAPAAERYIRQLGLSAQDLVNAGGQVNAAGNRLVGDFQANTAAVLKALEDKYSGVSELSSQTWQGMGVEIQNFMTNAGVTLGRDIFADMRNRLRSLLDDLSRPEVQQTLDIWATNLGKIWTLGGQAFDALTSGARLFLEAIRPATDALGQLIALLPSGPDAGTKAYDNLSGAIQNSAGVLAGLSDAAEGADSQMSTAVSNMRDQMDSLATESNAVRDKFADLTAPLRDQLTGLQQETSILKDHYDSLIQPWKDLLEAENRAFDAEKAARHEATLEAQISKDKRLAVDIYSSAGRSAADRLPGEEQQLADAKAEDAHKNEQNRINDTIKGLERSRDAQTAAIKVQEDAINAQLALYARAEQAQQRRISDERRDLQNQINDMNRYMNEWRNRVNTGVADSQYFSKMHGDALDQADAYTNRFGEVTGKVTTQGALDWKAMREGFVGDVGAMALSVMGPQGLTDALNGAYTSFNLIVQSIKDSGAAFAKVYGDVRDLAHSFGLDKGLAAMLLEAQTIFALFVEVIAQTAPPVFTAVGGLVKMWIDDFDVLTKYIIAVKDAFLDLPNILSGKGISKNVQDEVQAAKDAFKGLDRDASSTWNALMKSSTNSANTLNNDAVEQANKLSQQMTALFGDGKIAPGGGAGAKQSIGPPSPSVAGGGTPQGSVPVTAGGVQATVNGVIQVAYTCPSCHQTQFKEDVRVNQGWMANQLASAMIGRA